MVRLAHSEFSALRILGRLADKLLRVLLPVLRVLLPVLRVLLEALARTQKELPEVRTLVEEPRQSRPDRTAFS